MSKGNIDVFLEIEVENDKGIVIDRKRLKSDSFVKSVHRHLLAVLTSDSYVDGFIDINGNTNWVSQGANYIQTALAPQGDDSFGIQVGTASQSVTQDDLQLVAKIPNGASSGQMEYSATTYTYSDTALTMTITLTRSFDNYSGADITVNEAGLMLKYTVGGTDYYTLWARDVISATTVPNGGRLTIRYIIQINP